MMDALLKEFGENVSFDGREILYWPLFEEIASTSIRVLENKANLGYRAKFIKIAQVLQNGFPTMDELYSLNPEDARKN